MEFKSRLQFVKDVYFYIKAYLGDLVPRDMLNFLEN